MNLRPLLISSRGQIYLYFLLLTCAFIYAMLNISATIKGDFVHGHVSKAVCR